MKLLNNNDEVIFESNNMAEVYREVMDVLGCSMPWHVVSGKAASWTSIFEACENSPNNLTCLYDGKNYNNSLTLIK